MHRKMSYNRSIRARVKSPNLSTLISRRRLHSISTTRRSLSVTDRLTYRRQARNVHVVSHVAHPASRQVGWRYHPMVSLPPESVAEVRSRPSIELSASWVRCVRKSALLSHSFERSDWPIQSDPGVTGRCRSSPEPCTFRFCGFTVAVSGS